ncbi:MAG TPA: gas vesicle protein GvpJ [Solirubrobacteraceae bacterium]|nr:gas vesicle protein GvpJ [Solirubrobacteraceae bacterium]
MERGAGAGYVQRGGAGLYEIVDVLLDKGLVIDVFVRVSLVGIELLTVDARIVIASVDTYLRFAEAVNRLDLLQSSNDEGLPELMEDMTESGSENKTRGVLQGAKETLFGSGGGDEESGEEDGGEEDSGSRSSRGGSSGSRGGSSASARSGGSSASGSRSRARSGSSRGRSNS